VTLRDTEAGLGYADLLRLLEKGSRRQVIEGELFIDGQHVPRGAVAKALAPAPNLYGQTGIHGPAAPVDGELYELIDGERFACPPTTPRHQRALGKLYMLLRWPCGDDHETLLGPCAWRVDDRNLFQPDLVVAPREAFVSHQLLRPPTVAVEVVSPATRTRDWDWKRRAYARAGLRHYWIVDPDIPAIATYDLLDGRYVERHVVCCHERLDLRRPFPVVIHPTDLLTTR
jgi:Uma2 family endonuclease